MPFDQAARGGLEADVEFRSQGGHCADLGLQFQKKQKQIIRDEKSDGEFIGLDLLAFVLPRGSRFAQITLGASKRPTQSEHMLLQQKVTVLMCDAKPRRLWPPPTVDNNAAAAAHFVGQQYTLTTVHLGVADFYNPEGCGNLVDGNRAVERADLRVQASRQTLRRLNVGEIDAVKLQGATPNSRAAPASTSPFLQ